jgi:hypothetical protein
VPGHSVARRAAPTDGARHNLSVFCLPGALGRLRVTVVVLSSAGLALAALAPGARAASAGPSAACGASTLATIAAADATVTTDIYRNELAGTEVSFDLRQITGAADLRGAVTKGDRAAALKAVSRIVFHRGWHIVRLRVLDSSGHLLADVGGPYVIAPVPGVLRSGARVVGSFVMSVQDDVGVGKLETHFVGDPIGFYVMGKLVAERGASFPATQPTGAALTLGGVGYRAVAQTYNAFPTGTLSAVILVAPPAGSLTRQPCAVVRAGEFGRVAARLAALAPTLTQHYYGYASTVRIYTGAEVFVRDGVRQLTSTSGSGPSVLPTSGTVSYQGKNWLVFSFEPSPPTRVYLLIAPA